VYGGQGRLLLHLDLIIFFFFEEAATSVDRFRVDGIAARSSVCRMDAELDQFIWLQQNRHYDVSFWEGIGRNHSSADSISTNRRENAQFRLRKKIWETCGRARYTSGRD